MKNGTLHAIGAYVLWGLLPLYWKQIQAVPALEILAHRTAWALVVSVGLLLVARRPWDWLRAAVRSPRTLITFLFSAAILGLNWYLYIWAVNANRILDASLGYFINPLLSVLLGVIFLKERLRPWQWLALGLAAAGVLYLTFVYGAFPWVALTLAGTFGVYGLLRKTAALESLEGLALETAFMSVPALVYLLALGATGVGAFGRAGLGTSLLLAGAGAATALPLLLFASGARKIPLATVGFLQYIAPTLQFTMGAFVYGETIAPARLLGFCAVWAALLIYTTEGAWTRRRRAAHAAP